MKKRIFIFTIFCATSLYIHAQNPMQFEITYDNAGNRTTRKVLEICSTPKGGSNSKGINQSDSTYYVDQLSSIRMQVYPNPTQGIVYIDMKGNSNFIQHTICIFDDHGRKLCESKSEGSATQIDLSSYAAGIYLVELSANDERTTWKIIKR